nr:exosome complex component RRP41 homolog [Tanacetum cinerariifolium]
MCDYVYRVCSIFISETDDEKPPKEQELFKCGYVERLLIWCLDTRVGSGSMPIICIYLMIRRLLYMIQEVLSLRSSFFQIRCEYTMANFSTGDRMRKPKDDRRSTKISLVIRQKMEACILTHLMPHSQIDIFVQVLQADGALLCLVRANPSIHIIRTFLVIPNAKNFMKSTDLNYVEDSAGGPDVTVGILPKLDKVTLLQVNHISNWWSILRISIV